MPVMNGETLIKQEEMTPVTVDGKDPRSGSDLGAGTPPLTFCGGCGMRIFDRFYLVAVEQAWHSECLRCCECSRPLDTALSCFSRQARIYCREDYYRLFGVRRCNRCWLPLGSNELVMRARDAVFHLACFTCAACNQPLAKGDIFGMRDAVIYCRLHYEILQSNENQNPAGEMQQCDMSPHHQAGLLHTPLSFSGIPAEPGTAGHMISMMDCAADFRTGGGFGAPCTPPGFGPGIPPDFQQRCPSFFPGLGSVIPSPQKGRPRKRKIQPTQPSSAGNHQDPSSMTPSALRSINTGLDLMGGSDLSSIDGMVYDSSGGNGGSNGQQQRTKRMRTSFKHHQLRTMKSYFAINQNPDAKDLKQLAQKTGLSKRVLQVWFQNARAKWRRNMMRQQDGGTGSGGNGSGPIKDGHGSELVGMTSSSAQSSSSALGELTPPGSAGLHSALTSDETTNSNLVFSDLYSV